MAKKKSKSAKKPAKALKPKLESVAPVEPKVESAAPATFAAMFFPPEPRVPEIAEQSTVVKTEKRLYLCIAENSFCNTTLEISGMFGRGQIVDLGKLLKDGSELRTQVRINCFKPIGAGG